jgi:ketosteroid isomerase-like protein
MAAGNSEMTAGRSTAGTRTAESRSIEERVRVLEDLEAIRAVLGRYCRAIDRADAGLLSTVFHEDATDDHGEFRGSAGDFAKWAMTEGPKRYQTMQHTLGTINIELDGDVAYTEAYFANPGVLRMPQGGEPMLSVLIGRYVDRLERRHGEWRIASRVVVKDYREVRPLHEADDLYKRSVQGPEDYVYRRAT